MSRPDDVPSWKESTRLSWRFYRWMLLTIPLTGIIGHYMPEMMLISTAPAKAFEDARKTAEIMTWMMPLFMAFLWVIVFLNGIHQERTAKTPKEIEASERARLAYLKQKYGEE